MTLKEVEKTGNRILFFAIIIAVVLTSLCSCGSRRVAKSETVEREQKTEQSTLVIETKVNENKKIVEVDSPNEMVIEPIDSTKQMTVNGKKYINARIKWKKTSKVKEVVENKNVVKIERKAVKIESKALKVVKQKQVERKSSYYWLFWFLLLIPIYFGYRKFKDKIWFV